MGGQVPHTTDVNTSHQYWQGIGPLSLEGETKPSATQQWAAAFPRVPNPEAGNRRRGGMVRKHTIGRTGRTVHYVRVGSH